MPPMRILAIGYGAGDKDFAEHANVLRVVIGESSAALPRATSIAVIEANIDDSTPEVLGLCDGAPAGSGSLGRNALADHDEEESPGAQLTVLAKPEHQEVLAQIVFAETSTLGLRIYQAERRVQSRPVRGSRHRATDASRMKIGDRRVLAGVRGLPDSSPIAPASRSNSVIADANLAYLKESR